MILLSRQIVDGDDPVFPLLDVDVKRNAFGRQLDSFEGEVSVPVLGDAPVHGVFIRAPIVERVGPDVDVLARLDDGRIVAVRERNVIATAFHPELAGETRFHRLLAAMADEFDDPGEGSGRRRHREPPMSERCHEQAMNGRSPRGARPGKVRAARLTDLAALGDLSRLSQGEAPEDGSIQSLGLPLSGSSVSVFSLFRMPLGAFQPHDQLYVFEEDRHLAGLLRVERDSHRDEWTIVELDAIGQGEAGDIRYRLVQHLLRDGSKRGATRFHVACADVRRQRRAVHAARLRPLRRGVALLPSPRDRAAGADVRGRGSRPRASGPTQPLDALRLSQLYAAATPQPVARLEGYRLPDWERQGSQWRIPRSSLTPILRFADVSAFVQEDASAGAGPDTPFGAFVQVGVSKEEQPHYLRVIARPTFDTTELIRFGSGPDRRAGRRPPQRRARPRPRPRDRLARANLRGADRRPTGGGRLRAHRDGDAA